MADEEDGMAMRKTESTMTATMTATMPTTMTATIAATMSRETFLICFVLVKEEMRGRVP